MKTETNSTATINITEGLVTLAKGGIISLVGLSIFTAVGFIYQFILARLLGPAELGIYNLGFSICFIMALINVFGLDRVVVRNIAQYLIEHDRAREIGVVTSSLRLLGYLSLIITPLFFLSANFLGIDVYKKPELVPVIQVFAISVPFVSFTRVLMSILQAYKDIKPITWIEQITVPLLRIAGIFILIAIVGRTSLAATYSYLFAASIGCILAIIVVRNFFLSRRANIKPVSSTRQLARTAFPYLLATILNRTNSQTETLVIGALASSEQLGIYTVSLKVSLLITIFLDAISIIYAPFISEHFAKRDFSYLSYQYKTITRWALILALPVTLGMIIEAPDLMMILGPKFLPGAPVLQVLAIAQLLYVVMGPAGLILVMTKYNNINLIDLGLTLILSLILDFTLIPIYGAMGAAISGAITIVFLNALRLVQVYRKLSISPYDKKLIKPVGAGIISTIATISIGYTLEPLNYWWRFLIVISVLLVTYCASLWLFKLDDTDREIIIVIFKKIGLYHQSTG